MIGWSVKSRNCEGWARRSSSLVCSALLVGVVSNLAANTPAGGWTEYGAGGVDRGRSRAAYEVYVATAGGTLPSAARGTFTAHRAAAIPAFARKYNMACSACHTGSTPRRS